MDKKISPIWIISFIIPLVGIIAGAIKAAKNDPEGLPLFLGSFGFMLFWLVVNAFIFSAMLPH